jgi:hypothetical protein
MTLADWIIAGRKPTSLEASRRIVRGWVREHQGHVPTLSL